VLAALAGAGFLLVRRHRRSFPRDPATHELERALRRTRRGPAPGATLQTLERRFAGTPAAAGYIRAVRAERYGADATGPTAAERRGLRTALAREGGPTARLGAWWALPPW